MAKTLVINGADYTANGFDVVSFETVPCESITLNKQTAEIDAIGGTTTITATVAPYDTTDTVSWASSDSTVVTVADGVVTSVGVGTATITATCGTQSATCTVTSRAFMDTNVLVRSGVYSSGSGVSTGGNGLPAIAAAGRYGFLASSVGDLHLYGSSGADVYPYIVPNGAKRLKFTTQSSNLDAVYNVQWCDHTEHASEYSGVAKLISTASTISFVDGECAIDIPEIEGYTINSFVASIRGISGSTMADTDLEGIVVEFLPSIT